MKQILIPAMAAALLAGCAHRYDITAVNGMRITHVTRPVLNRETGVYTYTDIRGEKKQINASRVVEIAPHREPKPVRIKSQPDMPSGAIQLQQ